MLAIFLSNSEKYWTAGQLGHGNTNSVSSPVLIESLQHKNVTKIACGYSFSVVGIGIFFPPIKPEDPLTLPTDTGELFAFGDGEAGQLGIGKPCKEFAVCPPDKMATLLVVHAGLLCSLRA